MFSDSLDMTAKNTKLSFWDEATHPLSVTPMEAKHRFVVVTPVLNGAEYLDKTIASVLSQSGDFFVDYIIKDGGSKDGTILIVMKWCEKIRTGEYPLRSKGIRLALHSCADNGLYDAVAIGFEVRSLRDSDILTYINADDVIADKAFALCVSLFVKLPRASWLIGQPHVIDECGDVLYKTDFPLAYNRQDLASGLHDGRHFYFIQQEGSFWRASLYKLAGGLSRTLKLAGDYDLWMRFAAHAEPITLSINLGSFRKRPQQISSNIEKYYQEVDRILSLKAPINSSSFENSQLIENSDFGIFFNSEWTPNKNSSSQRPGAVCYIEELNALDELKWRFEVVYIKRAWLSY